MINDKKNVFHFVNGKKCFFKTPNKNLKKITTNKHWKKLETLNTGIQQQQQKIFLKFLPFHSN